MTGTVNKNMLDAFAHYATRYLIGDRDAALGQLEAMKDRTIIELESRPPGEYNELYDRIAHAIRKAVREAVA